MLLSFYKLGFAVIGLGWLLTAPAGAYTEEDLTIYAMLYPDLFVSQTQTVSAAPGPKGYRPVHVEYKNYAEAIPYVIDTLDLDRDGTDEWITEWVSPEGLEYVIFKQHGRQWKPAYKSGRYSPGKDETFELGITADATR